MSLELLFTLANAAVMPGWILLAVAPRWRPGTTLVAPVLLPALMALLYLGLLVTQPAAEGGGMSSLAGVKALFTSDGVLLLGWVHYLCFDLVVGSWEVRDAQRHGVPHLLVVPCLGLTLMLGPVGFLSYLALRAVTVRRLAVDLSAPPQA